MITISPMRKIHLRMIFYILRIAAPSMALSLTSLSARLASLSGKAVVVVRIGISAATSSSSSPSWRVALATLRRVRS